MMYSPLVMQCIERTENKLKHLEKRLGSFKGINLKTYEKNTVSYLIKRIALEKEYLASLRCDDIL